MLNLILFIRASFRLFVAQGAAYPVAQKDERRKELNFIMNTLYTPNQEQVRYLRQRFDHFYNSMLASYNETFTQYELYTENRNALLNWCYISFLGAFANFHGEEDATQLKYEGNLELCLEYMMSTKLPIRALNEAIELHRETIRELHKLSKS